MQLESKFFGLHYEQILEAKSAYERVNMPLKRSFFLLYWLKCY